MVIVETILLVGALGFVAHSLHERQQIARAQFGVKPPHKDHQKKSIRGLPLIPKTSSDVYIEYKRSRGTRDEELAGKLDVLEKQLAQFAPLFYEVREDYRLRESTSLPPSPKSLKNRRLSRLSDVSDSIRPSPMSLSPAKGPGDYGEAGPSVRRRSNNGKLSPGGISPGGLPGPSANGKSEIPPPYTADDEVRAHRMEVWNGQSVNRVEGVA
ncbi:hypothetical protein Q8F55_008182 [Vanrija albida]|uniref:Uncharacterized protein n=1 Tax=Vanrija albida TaxID=181172 RepID=A0ABR3PVK9_9TREE